MTNGRSCADALSAMAVDMRYEQTYLGASREACDNSGRIRWDRLQRVIDHLTASPIEQQETAPIPMLLVCPRCGTQHIDAPEVEPGRLISSGPNAGRAVAPKVTWENPPHRSHMCHACGIVWRPADVATVGVKSIETRGKNDTWTGAVPWLGHNRQHEEMPAGASMLDWAVARWDAEVKNRPLINVHRRSLDDTWRQVIRHCGGDDMSLLGPRHDDLVAANAAVQPDHASCQCSGLGPCEQRIDGSCRREREAAPAQAAEPMAITQARKRKSDIEPWYDMSGPAFEHAASSPEKWETRIVYAAPPPPAPACAPVGLTGEQAKADRDLTLYGQSFMLDGKHIPAERITIQRAPKVRGDEQAAGAPDRCYAPACGKWDGTETCTCTREPIAQANAGQPDPRAEVTDTNHTKLTRFAGLVLKDHRNDGYPGDVDGDVLQGYAEQCGLIEQRKVDEPCTPGCSCADVGEFPTICYFNTDLGRAAIDAARAGGDHANG
ncbi:TPA: hypothetical protein QDB14_001074 [Burkholderia vietnamiensis]|nr:hypothetical protein [Burkholderia vietnamiensis]